METTIRFISLIALAIMLLVIVARGTYEYFFNMPKWFAAPPASFEVIRKQAKGSASFWIPVQILFLMSYFAALISNWGIPEIKTYIIYAGLTYLLVIISTAAYFVKEIMAFQKMSVEAPLTKELQTRVNRWYGTTIIRNILQVLALILVLIAIYKIITA